MDVSIALFQDPDLQNELMELLGDRFGDFLETSVNLKVKEDFDKKIYQVVSEDQLPALRTFCRQYKPSLRG